MLQRFDIMTSTTSPRSPLFTWDEVQSYLRIFNSNDGAPWSLDVFPCPIDIFEIIASATFYYRQHCSTPKDAKDVFQQARHYIDLLRLHKTPDTGQPKAHLAEAFRLGAILYVQGILDIQADASEIHELVITIISHAKALHHDMGFSWLLSWPTFQAGLDGGQNEEIKAWLRYYFLAKVSSVGCRHGQNALHVLEATWHSKHKVPRTSIPPGALEGGLVLV